MIIAYHEKVPPYHLTKEETYGNVESDYGWYISNYEEGFTGEIRCTRMPNDPDESTPTGQYSYRAYMATLTNRMEKLMPNMPRTTFAYTIWTQKL